MFMRFCECDLRYWELWNSSDVRFILGDHGVLISCDINLYLWSYNRVCIDLMWNYHEVLHFDWVLRGLIDRFTCFKAWKW